MDFIDRNTVDVCIVFAKIKTFDFDKTSSCSEKPRTKDVIFKTV